MTVRVRRRVPDVRPGSQSREVLSDLTTSLPPRGNDLRTFSPTSGAPVIVILFLSTTPPLSDPLGIPRTQDPKRSKRDGSESSGLRSSSVEPVRPVPPGPFLRGWEPEGRRRGSSTPLPRFSVSNPVLDNGTHQRRRSSLGSVFSAYGTYSLDVPFDPVLSNPRHGSPTSLRLSGYHRVPCPDPSLSSRRL